MAEKTRISGKQKRQEAQYEFPYHHVARFRQGFRSTYYVKYGLKQVSSLAFILDQLKQLKFKSLCDLGCGDGRLAIEAAMDFPDCEITGIDYSERAINLANGFGPDVNFLCKDIISEGTTEQYDMVTLIEVFEHIPLDKCSAFIEATTKLIRTGGQLLVTVPHKNLPLSDKHEQHFDLKGLLAYFSEGYEVLDTRYLEKTGGWRLYLYYRLMKNKLFLLNHRGLLNWIYKGYCKHLLFADGADNCERLYLRLKKK